MVSAPGEEVDKALVIAEARGNWPSRGKRQCERPGRSRILKHRNSTPTGVAQLSSDEMKRSANRNSHEIDKPHDVLQGWAAGISGSTFPRLKSPKLRRELSTVVSRGHREGNCRGGRDAQALFQAPLRATLGHSARTRRCGHRHLAPSPLRGRTERQARFALRFT